MARKSYKAMVNDTIANALSTIQCRTIPYAPEWDTGLALCLSRTRKGASPFPIQEYDWPAILQALRDDTAMVLGAA